VISWADKSRSFTTSDRNLKLENGMEIVTHVVIEAQGFSPDIISTDTAESVEHLLRSLESGLFVVGRAGSTHIADFRMNETDVPHELRLPRREGRVTLRTRERTGGSLCLH
jgi:UPF0288 family protein (methanogenesis marker protein 3)